MTAGIDRHWWKRAVVYQIYPRSFADSTGDGTGDLRGIIAHVDHLSRLGVDVIWLSPVYRSPQDDNGYDISDYSDVDPLFGTLADLDELIGELHGRGIKLIMDLVVNHTSDEHPWFVASRSSLDNPKREWYWWRDQPNNWGSFFSGPAWELDATTGQYYLHLFTRKQPDLNWENPEVRAAVHEMMRWWLARGIDGFRMDVINLISKDPLLPDAPLLSGSTFGDGAGAVTNGPRLHEFLQEMHAEVFAGVDRPLLLVGETPGVTVAEGLLLTDPARHELDMVFHFEQVGCDHGTCKWDVLPLDLPALKAAQNRWQVGLADRGWNSLYWDNHDQPRVVSRWGDEGEHRERSAKLMATVLHLHRGTPYVYQGEELGMTNGPFATIDDFRDVESLNHYTEAVAAGEDPQNVLGGLRKMSRDNARTPMQWDAEPNAGFTTGSPWIAANPNHTEINAAAQIDDPRSVLSHYRTLSDLRHELPVVVDGDFTMLVPDHQQLYAFTRRLDHTELRVVANWSREPVDVAQVEIPDDSTLILDNVDGDVGPVLAPWECRVYRREIDGSATRP